jgi:hypothetical protein
MKVRCINSSSKPAKIPEDQWIKKGKIYTITKLVRMAIQGNKMGVLLKEVSMSPSCFPYEYYDADRFIPEELYVAEEEESVSELANLEELV